MRPKKFKTLLVAVGAVLVMLTHSGLAWGGFVKGQTCPVMIGRSVKEKFFVDYEGQRIYLCCAPCVKAFKKHPERYMKNVALSRSG